MRVKLLFVASLIVVSSQAQTNIEKTIAIKSGQKLVLNFDDPDVKLQTWDKNEVLIKGTVSINRGENDSSLGFDVNTTASEVTVTASLKDKENIPHRIVIKKDDKEYYFKTGDYNSPEVQKFLEENGKEYSYMTSGISKNIKLEVFVPKNTETLVNAKYGLIEVKSFSGPLAIDSKYGGVDATILAPSLGELTEKCRYGEILTNLDIKFDQKGPIDKGNKWTEISAKPGKGPRYAFESKYGNVYLRKEGSK